MTLQGMVVINQAQGGVQKQLVQDGDKLLHPDCAAPRSAFAGPYLAGYASEIAYRENNRRISNGEQYLMTCDAALQHHGFAPEGVLGGSPKINLKLDVEELPIAQDLCQPPDIVSGAGKSGAKPANPGERGL